jgi:Na+/melibiose symporter-like transporter
LGGDADTVKSRGLATTEHTRWNFALFVAESTFFMSGMAWVDPSAVLPLFIGRLTPSTVVIGAIAVVQQVGWKAPQIFMAAALGHKPHKLPYLRWPVLIGRVPFYLFLVYLWTRGVREPAVVIWFVVIAYASIAFGNGLLGISWNDIIAKSIPSGLRGRFFGAMQFGTAASAFGVGFVVRWLLGPGGPGFPRDYTLLFSAMGLFLALSIIGCWLVREPIRPVLDHPQSLGSLLRSTIPMLRERGFRMLVTTALLGFAVSYVMPFYVVYARDELGVAESVAGVYIWAMTVGGATASIAWGYLNDHRGPRTVLRIAGVLLTLTPLLAVIVPTVTNAAGGAAAPRVLPYVFAIVFLSGGTTLGAMWLATTTYLFELCNDADRPRFLAIFHLCTLPAALSPLLAGWLLEHIAFRAVFLLAAGGGAAALAASVRMPHVAAGGAASAKIGS